MTVIDNGLSLKALRGVFSDPVPLFLKDDARVQASSRTVESVLKEGRTVYGINTGFGRLAQKRIDDKHLAALQENLVRSHQAGIGEALDLPTCRLLMTLKAISLSRGFSGVRPVVLETLLGLINANIHPFIPVQGSVGASGDLAPLAALAAVLMGEGYCVVDGKKVPSAVHLKQHKIRPVTLGPKEGLALLNGTQMSTALALRGLFQMEAVFAAALVAGALSVDAAGGSDVPFDARIHKVRGQVGQNMTASVLRRLLAGSGIRESHTDCEKVQDPYSLRCQPQVMGAILDHMGFAALILDREAHAASDNPLVFPEEGDILSGGNFHAEPVALVADQMAIGLSEIANISERRTALLVDASMSGLPAFLVREGGVNSGFMIAHVTAAALASENKMMAHPASVDSIPTSANQEDHVSMATHGALRLQKMAENTAGVVAVELLAAAQGIDFRRPLKSSELLEKAHAFIREKVLTYHEDRPFTEDIEVVRKLALEGAFLDFAADILPSLKEGVSSTHTAS